ncbi:helix-turn-helix domain-containing protein [Streptomyces bauhiniae]|uniref:helix-turn-helix domain-containing protein n=1 Tax=Streptomyces bauhiniae TaxID=2340725 RepID=UPI001FCBA2AB|nr:Scr1 family TA system antitoxin-like transcriptional regulator [Streptomyces bauhiniae]
MAEQLPSAAEPDDGSGQKTKRKGTVRYLQDEPAPRAARMVLGSALRRCREAVGLSLGEAAARLGGSASKVSRIESGLFSPKHQDLPKFFALYKITDTTEQTQLRDLVSDAQRSPWWQPWSTVTPKYLQAVVSFEDMATRIRSYEPIYLHGLLQTPEYTRALVERGRGSAIVHDEVVQFRAMRRQRFDAAPDKNFLCIVDESSLMRPVGSADIMRKQLEHLAALTFHPRIQLRLAPLYDYEASVEIGPTTLFDFGRRLPTIAFAEGYDGGLFIEDERGVDIRTKAFDLLAARSLGPHAMRRRLRHMATRFR